jgi:peptide/nickel transport system substrate-binding protein
MIPTLRIAIAASALLIAISCCTASAQKPGGILRMYSLDSPPSMSIHEEVTINTDVPMMGVFNNLVLFDQHVARNSIETIVPELATRWSWSEDGTQLEFRLREGVKWHDGRPFTAADVKCTWDNLLGRTAERLRTNPRKSWYQNLDKVTADGDFTVSFHLKRPQPALLALMASGLSPIYPCHVPPREMRQHPIGTGPFKFVEFKPNERITVARNPDYWKKERPYLDGIEYTIIPNRSTAVLAFIAGKVEMTFPFTVTVPLLKDVKSQAPQALCELQTSNVARSLIINHIAAPFDKPDIRKAMAQALDRKAFIDILSEGEDRIGGLMLPPPEGSWGLPPEILATLPGYDPDVERSRAQARQLMGVLGYGPDKRLRVKVATRNLQEFRDTSIILMDQLKQIHIDSDLDLIETANWFTRLARKEYQIGFIFSLTSVDDPDQLLYENYTCSSERNYLGYCDHDMGKRFDEQSMEADQQKRKPLVQEIDWKLQQNAVRPIIAHTRWATCWQPWVKGLIIMTNSMYNGWRMEDVWLDK